MKAKIMMAQNIGSKSIFLVFLSTIFICFYAKSQTIQIKDQTDCEKIKDKLKFSVTDSVKLELSYMAYACGECYPQFRINRVNYSEAGNSKFYFNKEIFIVFKNDKLKVKFENLNCNWRCYRFIFSGQFKRNKAGGLLLEVDAGNISLIKNCCDTK